jgi:hypothetical protein
MLERKIRRRWRRFGNGSKFQARLILRVGKRGEVVSWVITTPLSTTSTTLQSTLLINKGQSQHLMHPPQPSHRRPSGGRPPPMAPPGVPVRADAAKAMFIQPHRPSTTSHMSMPPSPKAVYPPHVHQYRAPRSTASSNSSRPSPAMSSSSEMEGLRDSTRANIRGSMPPARQTSATLSWDVTSPKDVYLETPKELYMPQVAVRDPVEAQFHQLLVSEVAGAVQQAEAREQSGRGDRRYGQRGERAGWGCQTSTDVP